jgi:hypothetical protein
MEMVLLEFIINKIDTYIREKLHEETKEGKVHSGKGINVSKDLKDDNDIDYENSDKGSSRSRKYITIDGIKRINKKVHVKVEKVEKINEENSKGKILDAKK